MEVLNRRYAKTEFTTVALNLVDKFEDGVELLDGILSFSFRPLLLVFD